MPLKHRFLWLGVSDSLDLCHNQLVSRITLVRWQIFCLLRRCSAKFTTSVWHSCLNCTLPTPWREQVTEPHLLQTMWNVALHQQQSIRSKTATFILFCLPTASSTRKKKKKKKLSHITHSLLLLSLHYSNKKSQQRSLLALSFIYCAKVHGNKSGSVWYCLEWINVDCKRQKWNSWEDSVTQLPMNQVHTFIHCEDLACHVYFE